MLTFLSSMCCTSKIHPFSLGSYLGISLILGNIMRIGVTGVEMDMVRVTVMLNVMHHCFLAFYQRALYILLLMKILVFKSQQGFRHQKEACPLQPAVATSPLRLMLGKCIKIINMIVNWSILVSHYPKPPGGQPQRDFYAFSQHESQWPNRNGRL